MDKTVLSAKDGRYEITVTAKEVLLSVWSPVNGGVPVSKAAVIKDLLDRDLVEFDRNFVFQIVKEAMGTPTIISNFLKKKDGRYQIAVKDNEVFLTVWPPANGGKPVAKAAVMKDLTDRKLNDFDENFVSSIIKDATGVPAMVISSTAIKQLKSIIVNVRLNRLEAMIDIYIAEDAPTATMSELLKKLKDAGVVYGIDESILETLTQTRLAKNVICARATEPITGENAYLKYFFDIESQGRPAEQEDGRVDFKNTNNFLCVEKSELLVEKIPATAGIPGIDVLGNPIPARAGKDVTMPAGKNVTVVDNCRLFSTIDGHLNVYAGKRIDVIPVIVIEGDVDYNTGNIDFKGSVVVHGTIQPDFCVKAGGNVEVSGCIYGGTVEANKIIVHNGIQGMNRGVVKAHERLVAGFIENANVYCDSDIIVSDFIMNSSVCAGCRVVIEGGRGVLRGGRIAAGEGIRAVTIGNKSGIVTELEVSINPFFRDELLSLRAEIKKDEVLYEELQRSLEYIRRQGLETLTAKKRELYKKNEEEFEAIPERIAENRERMKNIENVLRSVKPGRIRVSDAIYPGTKMSIGPSIKVLKETIQYASLYVDEGEIKVGSLG
ncbi:MAG: hypothetical protein H6Q70_2017 [Firmicutes bacterium]|nr:hypothetical protein [Bacillota bacterium]